MAANKSTRRMQRLLARAPWQTACVALAALAIGCGLGARSEQRRIEGDTYLELGRIAEAVAAYNDALAADPENPRAHLGMARAEQVQGDLDAALDQTRQAYALAPTLAAAYQLEADIQLERRDADGALDVAGKLESVDVQAGGLLRASVLRRLYRLDEALTLLTQLREERPGSLDVALALAYALIDAEKPADAEAEAARIIADIDAEAVAPRLLLVDAYARQGRAQEILDQFEALAAAEPDGAAVRLGLASALLAANRADEAETIAAALLDADAADPWANYVMGAVRLAAKRGPEALPYLQTAARTLSEHPAVPRALEAARALVGVTPDAGAPLAAPEPLVAREDPLSPAPPEAPADWKTHWDQAALATLIEHRDSTLAKGDPFALETLVMAAVLAQRADVARELAARLPETTALRAFVEALDNPEFERLLAVFDAWNPTEPQMKLIRQLAHGFTLGLAGARAEAVRVLSEARTQWPENGVALLTISQVFRAADMPEFAIASLRTLVNEQPRSIEAHGMLFGFLRGSGRLTEARAIAETMYTIFPGESAAAVALATALRDTSEPTEAREILELALETRPTDPELLLESARLALDTADLAAAEAALEPMPADQGLAVARDLHRAFAASLADDWDRAGAICASISEDQALPVARFLYAAALAGSQQREEAAGQLLDPTTGSTAFGAPGAVALRALGQPESEGAANSPSLSVDEIALADRLRADPGALRSFLHAVALQAAGLHGCAYAVFGNTATALGSPFALLPYQFASLAQAHVAGDPKAEAQRLAAPHADRALAWMALSTFLGGLGDADGAREAVRQATERNPSNPNAWFRLGQLHERFDDLDAAIAAYRRAADLEPTSAVVNNNLAYCLLLTDGDLAEALARAQAAHEAFPGSPHLLHTLGLAQMRSGDLEAAENSFALALQLRPSDPTLLLDFGLLLIKQGQREEGDAQIAAALRYADQFGLPFPRRAEAEHARNP